MVNRFVTGFGLVIGALLLAFLFPGSPLLLLALLLGGLGGGRFAPCVCGSGYPQRLIEITALNLMFPGPLPPG